MLISVGETEVGKAGGLETDFNGSSAYRTIPLGISKLVGGTVRYVELSSWCFRYCEAGLADLSEQVVRRDDPVIQIPPVEAGLRGFMFEPRWPLSLYICYQLFRQLYSELNTLFYHSC